jgi:phage-related holin
MLILKKLFWACVLLFAPIKATLLTAALLVVADFITGIIASKRTGVPITSFRMRDTISKLIVYEMAILLGFLAQSFITQDVPFANIANTYVAVTEMLSCLENLNKITGRDLLSAVIAKINTFK